jgi:hypothetical protein
MKEKIKASLTSSLIPPPSSLLLVANAGWEYMAKQPRKLPRPFELMGENSHRSLSPSIALTWAGKLSYPIKDLAG